MGFNVEQETWVLKKKVDKVLKYQSVKSLALLTKMQTISVAAQSLLLQWLPKYQKCFFTLQKESHPFQTLFISQLKCQNYLQFFFMSFSHL